MIHAILCNVQSMLGFFFLFIWKSLGPLHWHYGLNSMNCVIYMMITWKLFTCTVQLSCGYSPNQPFNWYTILVLVYMHRRVNVQTFYWSQLSLWEIIMHVIITALTFSLDFFNLVCCFSFTISDTFSILLKQTGKKSQQLGRKLGCIHIELRFTVFTMVKLQMELQDVWST